MATQLPQLLLFAILYISTSRCTEDYCRQMHFTTPIKDKALQGHVIYISEVPDLEVCQLKCYLEPNCVSINLGPSKANFKRSCELCNADSQQYPEKIVSKEGYFYQETNVNIIMLMMLHDV
ncbi:hypothetical protein OS493_012545 [Desmophyllum pertusum]|uniref:Apple domain-containing protein n=1 Tax=Desmophyllum pertusum TaxID=174260 RepID=A0A9X0CZ65_9CNID|nr:hypothetical protein OS493_012545 [Desmophyllum pertusum]